MKRNGSTSDVIFLLGAGASVPLGIPTTRTLREKLCDDTPDGRLAAEIHRSAAYRFRISEGDINIELFLEHLYELQSMLWLASRSSLPELLPKFTGHVGISSSAEARLKAIDERAFKLLHETCGDCSGKAAEKLWRSILHAVSGRQPVIPVFTLNYDWTFENLAIESSARYQVTDGFDLLGGTWDRRRFMKIARHPDKTNIALFKLHGSTNWLPGGPIKSMGSFEPDPESDSNGYPPHAFEMVYPAHAHERRFGDEYQNHINDPTGSAFPWAEREPYKTLHGYLHSFTQRAKVIVIIGYAFGDKLVNAELAAAVNRRADTRVVVVDPGIKRYVKRTESSHWDAPFEFLTFGPEEFRWSAFEWMIRGNFGDKRVADRLVAAINREC